MAETKSTTRRKATTKSTSTTTAKAQEPVAEKIAPKPKTKKPKIPGDLDVSVVSNVTNLLCYNCIKTYGEEVQWSNYGDSQDLSFEELRAMKGRYPRYFRDNWIVLEDSGDYTAEEIYAALGVTKEYENTVTPDTIRELFAQSNDELEESLKSFSRPVKQTVYDVALAQKEAGQFDSISKFEIIRKAAGMDAAR